MKRGEGGEGEGEGREREKERGPKNINILKPAVAN